ncbi:MAG TPA: helix-turn-helix transcriptional regulator [Thermoanaerobaculia bacterium]
MPPHQNIVGENLRRIRGERQLSLADVAEKARISVATLSRIETSKQNFDVEVLLTLAGILGVSPAEILGAANGNDDTHALTHALSRLRTADRARIFLDSSRRRKPQDAAARVDDLLLTIDLLREELVEVQRAVRRRKR